MSFILPLHIKENNLKVFIQKMDNYEWFDIHIAYEAIPVDYEYLMFLDMYHYPKLNFNLPKLYMALFTLFGGHNSYDDYKCSFSYKFQLTIEKEGQLMDYALLLMDMKGNMPYFNYYKLPPDEETVSFYRNGSDALSLQELRSCTKTFILFLENFFFAYHPFFNTTFYRINRSAYLIYGFQDDGFFRDFYPHQSAEDEEDFLAQIDYYENLEEMNTPMSKAFWEEES